LGRLLPPLLSHLFPLLGAGLLLHCVEAAATVGSWPPRASYRASAAFAMAVAVPWAPAPTASLMDDGRRIKNIERKRSLSGDTPRGRCCFSFPMRTLGLRPCISMGSQSHLLLLNCPSKVFFRKLNGSSESLQMSRVSKMSRRTCFGRLARALAYFSFCDLIPAAANWASMRRNQICGSSSS
jgi:hypothetical protein